MVESEKTGIFYVQPSMVDMIPIGNIKPYKRNAKKHPQEQIEQIINSINAFGMNDPIGVWGEDNVIVEGHGRYLALKEMGESGLVGLTVRAMESAGARYYNDFVIVTPIGSLPIRAGKAFQASRKMGRTHQYCLCFIKGDPKRASERLGEVEIANLDDYIEE